MDKPVDNKLQKVYDEGFDEGFNQGFGQGLEEGFDEGRISLVKELWATGKYDLRDLANSLHVSLGLAWSLLEKKESS